MKKQHLTLLCFSVIVTLTAQTKGKISYKETQTFEFKLSVKDSLLLSQFNKSTIPTSNTIMKELYFNPEASLYQNEKIEKSDSNVTEDMISGEGNMMVKMQIPDDIYFCDLRVRKRFHQTDFMSRQFMIESNLDNRKWQLTGKKKQLLNYTCQEFVSNDTLSKTKIWVTSEIPVATGPAGFSCSSGMILEVSLDDGKTNIIATNIDFKSFDEKLLVKPKGGKKITSEQFSKMKLEKMEEMKQQYGGEGNVIIMAK